MSANLDRLRRAVKNQDTSAGKDKYLQLKEGEYVLRIFPFQHIVTELDLKMGYFDPTTPLGTVKTGDLIPVRKHFNPFAQCGKWEDFKGDLHGQCDRCDEAAMLADPKEAKSAAAVTNFVANVVNVTDYEEGGELWYQQCELPSSWAKWFISICDDRAYRGLEWFGLNGQDFRIKKNPKAKAVKDKISFDIMPERIRTDLKGVQIKGWLSDPYCAKGAVPESYMYLLEESRKTQKEGAVEKAEADTASRLSRPKGLVEGAEVKWKENGSWVFGFLVSVEGEQALVKHGDDFKQVPINTVRAMG